MSRSGDASTRVAVVTDESGVRDAAVDAVASAGSLSAAVPSSEGTAGVREAVESGADCLICGTGAGDYDAVREVDRTTPVVVLDPASGIDAGTLDRVLDDPAAAYVAGGDHLGRLVRSRVREFVGHGRLGWQLADRSDDAVVAFDLATYAVREANDTFFEHWALSPADLDSATLADLRETDLTHEHRGRGRGEPGEEDLEWVDGDAADPVETFVEGALTGDFERREWHCRGPDGPFKSEVEVVADRSAGTGYLVASVTDGGGSGADDGRTDHDDGAMLRSVMEHVPMSVYFEDRRGRHVRVSEDLVEPFIEGTDGKIMHTPEDVLGKTYFDLYTVDMAERAAADNERIMETGEPLRDQEKHVQPPHGRDLWFSTNKAPWYDDDGRLQGVVGITVDITDRKRRERELDRQNERLEEFAGILSHDLRNPLNVAEGRLDRYRQTGDESELDAVAEMHDRMGTIIDDVLDYAREGSRVEETEWFDGATVAARAWGSVDTGVATLEQDWAYAVEADPDRLARLFENCFRNGVEHGGSDVTVRVGTLDEEAGFYVEDDGPGIPEDVRGEVFDRGVTTDDDGTGFGLAIVREIAEAHGWEVAATESDAGGARFEFAGVPRGDDLD
ncbi:PAS domain-containing sensor histidine kinase [Halosimplex marinum]|uniref:sensor histidine kinase n=1 Tax=Halosimplex marinum TaxID=3396620 RepID=UPI003F55DCFC